MNYHALRTLLDTQLQTATGLPPLQTENTRYTTTNKTPWCRSTLLPAEPSNLNVGHLGTIAYRGLYQVDLFYPQGDGSSAANATAAAIQEALPSGYMATLGSGNFQIEMSWQDSAYVVDSWYVIPVVVRWVAYL